MRRLLTLIVCVQLLAVTDAHAQSPASWTIHGDTTGAPTGCSASAAIASINRLIAGMHRADQAALARALALKFVFSVIPLTGTDKALVAQTIPELLHYARMRQKVHERMKLEGVTFNGWRGKRLEFGPIYFLRSADDLGKSPLRGGGKGTYECGKGISIFNLGRLSPNDRGR